MNKTLWINAISPEMVAERPYIPTAVHYGDRVSIGTRAMEAPDGAIINQSFKVDIGDISPGQSPRTRKLSECDDGTPRSAFEITRDYIEGLFSAIHHRLPPKNKSTAKNPVRLLVAEPLSFQVAGRHSDWLSNYRRNLTRILSGYESVEFLPEPFAVYQYYRYGLNLPALADRTKHIALIVDFGGGTFDVSVIETTQDGDVSMTGKHAKPLAGSSTPFAGFYINRQIAQYLIKRPVPDHHRSDADRYIRNYDQWVSGQHQKKDFRDAAQRFIENFMALERKCESYKIELSSVVLDWRLNAEAYEGIRVTVPRDPFVAGDWMEIDFKAHQMRNVFVQEVWNKHLKPAVKQVFERARSKLRGRSIDVTLISGGSANIGWLRSLLVRDFAEELAEGIPVGIQHSFQDVVANGLAIECARRHYTVGGKEDAEFVAVTYNPIRLLLGANEDYPAPYRFRSVDDEIDMDGAIPGDLIPSAQSLRHFFDERLRWRVKLPHRPSRSLEYLFCRPNDKEDKDDEMTATVFNVEETTVYPDKRLGYDSRMMVEMTVREDGTAAPRFVYQRGNASRGIEEHARECRPFYIDMTTSAGAPNVANYVGFDFGSSNSAICCLSNQVIEAIQAKGSSSAWQGISEALVYLPFPASYALRRYLSCQDGGSIADAALAAYEACLGVLSFCMATEAIHRHSEAAEKLLKPFRHRSLGPLRGLLERSSQLLDGDGQYFSGELVTPSVLGSIDQAIENFNNVKHHKADGASFNWHDHLEEIVQLVVKSFDGLLFGYCASSEPVPLAESDHRGSFVVAHDSQPFVRHRQYSSPKPIDSSVALVVDPARGCGISATPLFLWIDDAVVGDRSCYLVDNLGWDKAAQLKPCHRKGVAPADLLMPAVVPLIEELRDAGRLFLGEVSITLGGERDSESWA